MGVDYGTKRIGLAITDPLQMFASPLTTISPVDFDNYLKEYLKTNEIDAFVIGYPMQLNNEPSASVVFVNPFIKKLKKKYPEKEIFLNDERFTSHMAKQVMLEGGLKKKDRQDKSITDKISASIILQSYLDRRSNKEKNNKL